MSNILDPIRAAALVAAWDFTGDPIDRWRQAQRRRRFISSLPKPDQHALGRQAEQNIAGIIRAMGYQVNFTTHKCPFDLWVANDQSQAVRVEVKIALYYPWTRGGRFQARIHNQADILIFIARPPDGRDWIYIIPMAKISTRKNIAIWSECPGNYTGQWSSYLDDWSQLDRIIAASPARPHQLTLGEVTYA